MAQFRRTGPAAPGLYQLRSTPDAMRPKVSVCLITYNHAEHVAEAMDSILCQRTAFPWELVIGDDASSDGTSRLILERARARPDVVRAHCRPKNVGMVANFAATLGDCRGEYVALLEGDDYWTSDFKLQRQVELLDAHPEAAACFHQTRSRRDDGTISEAFPDGSQTVFQLRDILRNNPFSTSSAVLRSPLPEIPPEFATLKLLDWPLWVLMAKRGDLLLIPSVMSTYRVHEGGTWSRRRLDDRLLATVHALERVSAHVDGQSRRDIENTRLDLLFDLAWWSHHEDQRLFQEHVVRYLRAKPLHRQARRRVNLALRAFAPQVMRALDRLRGQSGK